MRNPGGMLLVTAAVAAIAYGGTTVPDISENERHASTLLTSLTSANADFRANDLDANGINDFWTGDISGLYSMRNIRRISRSLAEADAKPLVPLTPKPISFHGYHFVALEVDENSPHAEDRPYKQDTGGIPSMGKVHNTSKFGFQAYPAVYGVTGRYSFLVNENNTVFRSDNGGKPLTCFPKIDLPQVWGCTCPEGRTR